LITRCGSLLCVHMEPELPSDHETFVCTAETPTQRPSSKRLVLITLMAVAVAAIFALTVRAKPHDADLHTSEAVQLYESNPHGVCSPPAEMFNQPQMGCPTDHTDSCVAGNRDYVYFSDAWEACGRVPECGAIMRWTSGNYYLRRVDDPKVPVAGAFSMFYSCNGQGAAPQSTYQVQNAHCQPPTSGFVEAPKGCRGSFPEGCVGGSNLNYRTLYEAWEACGETPGCELIMRWSLQGRYYLRRFDDPDLIKAGAGSIRYEC